MSKLLKLSVASLVGIFLSNANADDSWVRDIVYKCDDNYTISFHQTDLVNDVVLLRNDILVSKNSKPYQENVITLDGVLITSTDLSDNSGMENMTQEQMIKKVLGRPNYSFVFEKSLSGANKNKPKTGLIVFNAGNYQFLSCSEKK